MDIIVALGMAKGGFRLALLRACTDHRLPQLDDGSRPNHRSRHSGLRGKTHAQFTNLIAQPDAADEDVKSIGQ